MLETGEKSGREARKGPAGAPSPPRMIDEVGAEAAILATFSRPEPSKIRHPQRSKSARKGN